MDRRWKAGSNEGKDKQKNPQYYGSVGSQRLPSNAHPTEVQPSSSRGKPLNVAPKGVDQTEYSYYSGDDDSDYGFTKQEIAWLQTVLKDDDEQEASGHASHVGEKVDDIDAEILSIAREYSSYSVDSPPRDE